MTSREWEVAKEAYDAYHNNEPSREFEDLEPRDRERWLRAAQAVIEVLTRL